MIDAILKMFTPSKKQDALDYATEALSQEGEDVSFQLADPPDWVEELEWEATRQECLNLMHQTRSCALNILHSQKILTEDIRFLNTTDDVYTLACDIAEKALTLRDSVIELEDLKVECMMLDHQGEHGGWDLLDPDNIEMSMALAIPDHATDDELLEVFWPSLFGGSDDDLHFL
tara:strand:- start:114 stop:635 length:522 start_codon:yes stop_codon:yes gene_type:complete